MVIRHVFAALLLLFASIADATTYYVSSTADNGYGVGADANAGTGKAAGQAWLTVDKCISAGSAGDTCVINGGAVAETNVYTAATTFYNDTKGIIFTGDNRPKLQSNGAQARVLNQNTTSNTSLIGVTLDASNGTTTPLTISAAASAPTITVSGCKLFGGTTYGINNSSSNLKLVVTGSTITAPRSAIQSVALATGSYNVSDNVLTSTAISNGNEGVVVGSTSATGVTAYVGRNKISATFTTSGAGANPPGAIHLSNMPALVERNDITVSGPAATVAGVAITSGAAVLAENGVVRWNTIRHSANTGGSSGYLVLIGADATGTTADNQMNYWSVYGNYMTGTSGSSPNLHGTICGFIKACYVFGNFIDYADIHTITKDTTETSLFAVNTMAHSTGADGMMRMKGAARTLYVGNRLVTEATNANKAMYVTSDGATNSANGVFAANSVNGQWTVSTAVTVDASQTAAFLFNNYDFTSVTGTPWSYQGVTSATLAAWIAAQEPTARGSTVGSVDKDFWNAIGMRSNGLPPSGVAPFWGR